jgi:V-type H+-transporting ATPase subunit E
MSSSNKLQHIISYIMQEAADKAEEIAVQTEDAFEAQKAQIVTVEKARLEAEHRKSLVLLEQEKRIAISNCTSEARLTLLRAREELLESLVADAKASVKTLIGDADKYASILADLAVQAHSLLSEPTVHLVLRGSDAKLFRARVHDMLKDRLPSVEFKVTVEEVLPEEGDCPGGLIAVSVDGKIRVDNTFATRFGQALHALLPDLRAALFADSPLPSPAELAAGLQQLSI